MDRCARCHGELQPLTVFCPHCAQAHELDLGQLLQSEIGPPFGAQPAEGPRYRIYRRLGRGGLSTLFAATDLQSDRVVAIKVSDPSQLVKREMSYAMGAREARAYWEEMIERMRREAETLATIDHPNIVRFFGAGMINDDLRYVVMEFLRGRTLREELDGLGRIEARDAVRVGRDVAAALGEVHGRGIIHRDINPQNIFIDCGIEDPAAMPPSAIRHPKSIIKLIDFGIAKFPQPPGAPPFTHHSAIGGTAAYASPEQCQSRPLDHRSDIYSLGVALYEMVTGQRPFSGRTPTEIALKHIEAQPAPLRSINAVIPGNLERTVLRAMAKSPADRHQSAEELADDLRLGAQPIVIQLPSSAAAEIEEPERGDEPAAASRSGRLGRAVFAAALLIILGAGWMFGRQLLESLRSAVEARNAAVTTATPSPSPISSTYPSGSDADSMELAAAHGAVTGATTPSSPHPGPPITAAPGAGG
ncbi:MAG: serine/threonine-protein kinase, partial [Blastocatellia bacterium]